MTRSVFITSLLLTLLAGSGMASAQETGDAAQGRAFAANNCTACHAVQAGEEASPLHTAPSFTAVANTPGVTELALHTFFRTSHKNMPNFIIASKDIDDVTAYILSLKEKK